MSLITKTAETPEDFAHVAVLFQELADDVGSAEMTAQIRHEIERLPGMYAPPRGTLLLVWPEQGGEPVACVGLRPLPGPGDCELKRLYVRHSARSTGLGVQLGLELIGTARERGYKRVLLEAHEGLDWAMRIYGQYGFRPIPYYYANPRPGTVFLALNLSEPESGEGASSTGPAGGS